MKYLNILFFITFSLSVSGQICVGEQGVIKWQCWQNLYDNEVGELYAEEDFPLRPDYTQNVYRTQSPINFDNLMGARLSGFIMVDQTDDVTFNLTGDDYTRFYLSTDDNPDNKVLQAYADGYTNIENHDEYPTQTSSPITLTAGEYYYFELLYIEGSGGDHITLWWQTINDDPTTWKIITANFLYDVDCLGAECPERGTPCDDNDSTTTNDMEDGFCNCQGMPETTNSCIGERGLINMYVYDSIPGGELNDLYTHPDFPGMPQSSKRLEYLSEPWKNDVDSVGNMIQAFINVPVTGNYRFNITGNNECIFFISSDETPENKQAHQIIVTGATDPVEHDKYIWQSTSNLYLEKEKFYYIELNHKEGSYSEHFGVFWQTPFTQPDTWKRIPSFYIYDYECEVACIPEGYVCDDGDPFTKNDQYDANCDCVGVPCDAPNCDDPLANYQTYPKCDLTDQIDNRTDNNWLSCSTSPSPNALRSDSHWIMYDFNQAFVMQESHVWNYNADPGFEQGFEQVAVDYSEDGSTWNELGIYNWSLTDGSSEYSGFVGPDFDGVVARYVLITSLTTGQACRGFGKIVINAEVCLNQGTVCDDGNPFTVNDMINEHCECLGTNTAFNDCDVNVLTLGDTLIVANAHSAINLVESENTIGNNGYVMYISGNKIDLNEGFEVALGSNFEAIIEQCTTSADDENDLPTTKQRVPSDILKVLPIPDTDQQIIEFYLEKPGMVQIDILNKKGEKVFNILDLKFTNKGIFQKNIRTHKFEPGVYNVIYKTEFAEELEKLTVQ